MARVFRRAALPLRSSPVRRARRALGAALAVACAPRVAAAQHRDRDGVPREQLSVVSRRAARGDWAHQQADRAVWLVRQEDIARQQPRTVADALRDVPGVFFVPTAPGGVDDVVVRGLGGPRNLVLLDGVPLSGAGQLFDGHGAAFGNGGALGALAAIDPWALARVEVQPGPAGVTWGPGAAGGVISLETAPIPEPDSQPLVRSAWRLRAPDLGVTGAHEIALRGGPFGVRAGLTFRGVGPERTGGGAWLPHTEYANVAGRVQGWYVHRGWEVRASYYGGTALGLAQTDPAAFAAGGYQESDQTAHLVRLSQRVRLGTRWVDQVEAVLFARMLGEGRLRVGCAGAPGDANERAACLSAAPGAVAWQDRIATSSTLLGGYATVHFGRPRDRVRVAAGADYTGETLVSARRPAPGGVTATSDPAAPVGLFALNGGRITAGTFVRGEVDVWGSPNDAGASPRLVVSAGARVALVATTAVDALAAPTGGAARAPELSDAVLAPLGTAGVRFLPSPAWAVFANWSQGITPADPLQSVTRGDAAGSAFVTPPSRGALRAERTNAVELGARWQTAAVRAQLALFATLVTDRAARGALARDAWAGAGVDPAAVPAGLPVVQWSTPAAGNAARYLGGELSVSATPWRHWTLWGHAAFVWGEADVPGTAGSTEPAPRVPPPAATLGVRYERRAFYLELFARGALGQDRLSTADRADPRICPNGAAGCTGSAPWATLNARAAFRLSDALTLDAAVFNATDTRYRYFGAAVDQPGVDAVVTLSGEI